GSFLRSPQVNVVVAFSSKKEAGDGFRSIDLLVNGAVVASVDIPRGDGPGSHSFATDFSSFANTGSSVSLLARGFLARRDRKYVDSASVGIVIDTATRWSS